MKNNKKSNYCYLKKTTDMATVIQIYFNIASFKYIMGIYTQ